MRDYRNIFNKVVPYHTDDSMSLYEFVGRLYDHLKDFEGSLEEAHEKIDEFIHSFTMELDATTKKTLTEWHDDGTLAELINLVWDDKAEKYYVDNLINQIANTLTDNYTQADDSLRDQIAGVRNRVKFQFINDSVLDYARNMTGNFQVIRCSSPTDVPSGYQYASGFIFKRDENNIHISLYGYRDPAKMVNNIYYGEEWRGWEEVANKTYVDTVINNLTNDYTQADDSLRGQVNANVSAVETALDNKITGVESSLNTKITANTSYIDSLNSPLIYRGAIYNIDELKTRASGYYHLTQNTINNPGFYYQAPVLVLRRFGNEGSTLVIGCKATNAAEVMCHFIA